MVAVQVALATEDPLSEAIARRLIEEVPPLQTGLCLRRGGSGYLRSRVKNFCEMARQSPVLLITDLDRHECAPSFIAEWMGKLEKPEHFLFRVPVREIESWVLADHEATATLLGCAKASLPRNPDALNDAKQALLQLARKAPRALRSDLVAEKDAVASQGLGYNQILGEFVRSTWCPIRAAANSNSLARARASIRELALSVRRQRQNR